MSTTEISIKMKEYIAKLVKLFLDRNKEYAGEEDWAGNFNRNAWHVRNFNLKEIIEDSYGQSIKHVVEKVDRLVNGLINQKLGFKPKHLSDNIDDAIVYLFITKRLLIEEGIIIDDKIEESDIKHE